MSRTQGASSRRRDTRWGESEGQSGEQGSGRKRRRRRSRGRRKTQDQGQQAAPSETTPSDATPPRAKRRTPKGKGRSSQSGGSNASSSAGDSSGGGKQSKNSANARSSAPSRSERKAQNSGYKTKTPKEKFGGREPVEASASPRERALVLSPFELLCTYHLGITPENGYRKPQSKEVARRFSISLNELNQALQRFGVDRSSLSKLGFDISLAQLDIRVAPEGIDRREIAKIHFAELCELDPDLQALEDACHRGEEEELGGFDDDDDDDIEVSWEEEE